MHTAKIIQFHLNQTDPHVVFYLLPEISMNLIAIAMDGSINKVVMALTSRDADDEVMPRSKRRGPTPARSRIWGM